jgi:hypothetical protein
MNKKTVIVASIGLLLAISLSVPLLSSLRAGVAMPENFSGTYTRETANESADIKITLLPDGKVQVTGMAFWGTQREYGPNIGELDFTSGLVNGHIRYSELDGQDMNYALELTFTDTGLTAKEEGSSDNFGLNVSFAGDYKKASAPTEKN